MVVSQTSKEFPKELTMEIYSKQLCDLRYKSLLLLMERNLMISRTIVTTLSTLLTSQLPSEANLFNLSPRNIWEKYA